MSAPLTLYVPESLCHGCGERRWQLGIVQASTYADLQNTNRAWAAQVRWDCANPGCDEWVVVSTSGDKKEER